MREFVWKDHPKNPLIRPTGFPSLLADPTYVPAQESPDKKHHLFCHNFIRLKHFTSRNGVKWELLSSLFFGFRPYIFHEKKQYYMLFERFTGFITSSIFISNSKDMISWEKPTLLLKATEDWEKNTTATCSNPCVIKHKGEYLLYYGVGTVFLPDCLFIEPRHIGLATAKQLYGPYKKRDKPIISPSPKDQFRNLGAGSIKVLKTSHNTFVGFNNGIYRDNQHKTRSGIRMLTSTNGIQWKTVDHESTMVLPSKHLWKKAFVYGMDVKKCKDHYRMYYNARDGWLLGKESIGLATTKRLTFKPKRLEKIQLDLT